MARLPIVGSDDGTWGDILNDYLSQAHKPDGTLRDNAVTANTLAPNSVTNAAITSGAVNATSIADGSINETLLDTNVQAKLNAKGELAVNVRDYGATGDGTTDDTTSLNTAKSAAVAAGKPLYIPAGVYKITSTLDWKVNGLVVITDGSATTEIRQFTANTQIISVAGQHQDIGGLALSYDTQQTSGQTSAIGIGFGDNTVGSSFASRFYDLWIKRANTAMAINPAVSTVAGLFSCRFQNIHIWAFSNYAIRLEGANSSGAANATGCVFDNTYMHNTTDGTACANYPVFLKNWDEIVFSQLNIEHGTVTTQDVLALIGVGTAVINGLHVEAITHSADGKALLYLSASKAVVTGFTSRLNTFTGAASNPVTRYFGDKSKLIINGWTDSSNTVTTPSRPIAAFGSATNADVTLSANGSNQATVDTTGGDSTDRFSSGPSTSTALGVGSVELGHASDTTLSRSAAGVLSVEGVVVPTVSSTNTLTNKRLTPRVSTTSSSATPTINTDNTDIYGLTALAVDITSMTTNLSGAPTDGQMLWLYFIGTGTRAIAWGASFEAGAVPLPTSVGTTRLDVALVWNTGTSKWRCMETSEPLPSVTVITSSATPTINTDYYQAVSITALATDITSMTTNLSGTPTNFQRLFIRIKDNGTARAITWGASFQSGSVALPTTTFVTKTLLVGLVYDTVDAKWTCEATGSRA